MKFIKIAAVAALSLALLIGGGAAYVAMSPVPTYEPAPPEVVVESSPERVARGRKLANLLCVNCHLNPVTRQLTGKRMEEVPQEFGPIFSANITQHPQKGVGGWTDGELVYLLRTGVTRDGRYIPPYMVKLPHMSDEDLHSVIAFMRSDDPLVRAADVAPPGTTEPSFLTKMLTRVAWKPLPMPKGPVPVPPEGDPVALGEYLVNNALDCFPCHSADFKTMNVMEPTKTPGYLGGGNALIDLRGNTIVSSNITFDETGLAGWTRTDFVRALRDGFLPDDSPIRYPMVPMPDLTDAEIDGIFAYLQTVPKIQNEIDRHRETASEQDSPGKTAYYRYGCHSCHGDDGVGIADVRNANVKHSTDETLIAWIRDAPASKPDTRMPKWDGVIEESDYAPLVAYIRSLGPPKNSGGLE